MTDVSNEALNNLTLVIHVLQHRGHVVVMWFRQCRAKHDGQVVAIHLDTKHQDILSSALC